MAKVVGLSGAQGGGKSTLLSELCSRGYTVDAFKVSRAVQKQLGWETLERVMDSPQTMMTFQQEVWRQKYHNDKKLKGIGGDFILTERTFADIAAYTTSWTWKFVDKGDLSLTEASDFLTPYLGSCSRAQLEVYDAVLLLPFARGVVKWEADPHRASLDDADSVYESVVRFTEGRSFLSQPRFTITERRVLDRADQVETFLKGLK
jgi:predicted ATPase